MSEEQSKSQQLYVLARHVLPKLSRSVYLNGKQYRLRISRRRAEYIAPGDVIGFAGRTTLGACIKMLEWAKNRENAKNQTKER